MPQIDPKFLDSDEVHAAVNALDIGRLYRLANRLGVSQRQIAELTGQTQSEVCEILKGRQVINVHVLRRIADGFGIPRAGCSWATVRQNLTPRRSRRRSTRP